MKALMFAIGLIFTALTPMALARETSKFTKVKTPEEIKAFAKSVTVQIYACTEPTGLDCSSGTGFVVRASDVDTTIVTNKHVCEGARLSATLVQQENNIVTYNYVIVRRTDSDQEGVGQIMKVAQNSDLCSIHTRMTFKSVPRITRRNPVLNETLYSFGYSKREPTWVTGVYEKRDLAGVSLLDRTNLPIYPGHSGSAVFNKDGEIIGVINSYLADEKTGKSINSWMVPAQHLLEFLGDK